MKFPRSKPGVLFAIFYLFVVLFVTFPLIRDQAIHHGNGIVYLAALVITSPLSWLFSWIVDQISESNLFYLSGGYYYVYMGVLIFAALFNAVVINVFVSKIVSLISRPTK